MCADTLLRCPAQHLAVRNVRRVLWKRMLNIRMDYYDANDPSKLMSTVTNDASDAVRNLVFYIVGVIPALYYAIRALSTISTYNVWLMVSIFMLLPIKILYMFYIGKRRFKTQKGLYQQIGGLTGYLAERVRNLSLIKTYTNEPQELKNGEDAAKHLFDANMKVVKLECTISALATGIGLAQNLIVMVFGVVLLQKGAITLPQWVAFFMFSGTISNTFDTIISYWTDLKTIQGSLARASHLMNVPVETEDGTAQLPDAADITFENVSFAYGDKQALENNVCRNATQFATSVTSNYKKASYVMPCPASNGWNYIKRLGHDPSMPEIMAPCVGGGSSSTFTRDGMYMLAQNSGNYEWMALGNLNNGLTNTGLSCANANNGLTNANWNIGGRHSGIFLMWMPKGVYI